MGAQEVSADQEPEIDDSLDDEGAPTDVEPLSYFGTDFDVHGLVRRLNGGDIVIPSFDPQTDTGSNIAGFQRSLVWKQSQMEKFIESLLLGFPVPGIFLVQQLDKKLLVLDGQQRLRTLQKFYANEFSLSTVTRELRGKTYTSLDDEMRRVLDNTFIHATIVKYDPSNGGENSVYQLFERLNTGGTNLYPHEIRVALFNGAMVQLIRDLNLDESWRALIGKRNARLKDQELILRFFALYYDGAQYERPLKGFLNDFVKQHRDLEGLSGAEMRSIFERTCKAIADGIGPRAFRLEKAVNAALVDSVMVGVARRVAARPLNDVSALGVAHEILVTDAGFLSAIGRATADEDRVKLRLDRATAAFEEA